jgi:opacity protein-like surface antigen
MYWAAALTALLAGGIAQAAGNSGFYMGGGIGTAVVDVKELEFSERDLSFKILAGYALSDFIAIEAAYFDGGKPEKENGNESIIISATGYNASVVLRARTGSQIVVFGKIGYAEYDFDFVQKINGVAQNIDGRSDRDLNLGLGVNYNFRERYMFRAEYERAEVAGAEFQLLSLVAGILF